MSTDAMHVAKTGLNAQQTRMQVIANNLANVNTTGFKRDRANFETLLYQNTREVGAQTSQNTTLPTGLAVGTGVRVVSSEKLYTQGNIDGVMMGYQEGAPGGNASVTKDGQTYTITGTATGMDMANPMQPMTKPFEIKVSCPR